MPYRVTTRDGTVFNVPEADLGLITAYLALKGYPPVSIECVDFDFPLIEFEKFDARDRKNSTETGPLARH